MGACIEPGSGPGVEGGGGMNGVIAGPRTPGGDWIAGVIGSGIPEKLLSIWFAGIDGTHGSRVTGIPA